MSQLNLLTILPIRAHAAIRGCWTIGLLLLLTTAFSTVTLVAAQNETHDETISALLKIGVEQQLQGDFDRSNEIAAQLQAKFPSHAIGHSFAMNTLVTQLSWDTSDTQYDEALEREAKTTLKLCRQQIDAEPESAAGYHSCGQAHFALTFLYAARGSYYRAGRNSSQTITQLEAALARDASLADAKMHLGATYYYADNLPPFVKAISRFLWFIPTGNSDKALPYMREAAEEGRYLSDAAKFIFADLVMSSEPTLIDEAGLYLIDLVTRYPSNRRFQLKYMQFLAQTKQHKKLLAVTTEYMTPEPQKQCCLPDPVDANLARMWRVQAHLALQDRTAAQTEFARVDSTNFPEWGHEWHRTTAQQLATP